MIEANVRTPAMTLGDIWAQVASCRLGAFASRNSAASMERHDVRDCDHVLLDYGEAMVLRELAKLPNGVYTAEDWIDDDGLSPEPHLLLGQGDGL